jgi:hypothetical protein
MSGLELELPDLPDLSVDNTTLAREFGNPTRMMNKRGESWKTYWAVKGRILAGGYPGEVDDDDNDDAVVSRLKRILLEGEARVLWL